MAYALGVPSNHENYQVLSSPLRGCVVMMMEGRFRRNPALAGSGSSALECGRLKVWVINLLKNWILFMGLEPRS
jgi:hypothetical protein